MVLTQACHDFLSTGYHSLEKPCVFGWLTFPLSII
uniref:Uncharacterized protein n=1 Tax=Rhizophora mucronata TaxID=61149 RepID=A0A2P2M732_RHIMU